MGVINKEKIATSYYPSKQKVIAVGTKEVIEENEEDDPFENVESNDNNSNEESSEQNSINEQNNIENNEITNEAQ